MFSTFRSVVAKAVVLVTLTKSSTSQMVQDIPDEHCALQKSRDQAGIATGMQSGLMGGNTLLEAKVVPVTSPADFPLPRKNARTALCFPGGGTRAMVMAMGQYRALTDLGILSRRVDAISSVSGGTWASSQYMFADRTAGELLGAASAPSELTMEVLNKTLSEMGQTAMADTNEMLLSRIKIEGGECFVLHRKKLLPCASTAGQRLWIDVVAQAFLRPYGLDKNEYMANSQEDVNRIVRGNPSLKRAKWRLPQKDRPKTFVMSGSLGAPVGYKDSDSNVVSLQMSPDYIGSPFFPDGSTVNYTQSLSPFRNRTVEPLNGVYVGGGFVETFAFGGEAQVEGGVPPPASPFTLADAVGISSAAFAELFTAMYPTSAYLNPQGLYWPVMPLSKQQTAQTFQFQDGGNIENTGILAMMQSGAHRIIVFVNTDFNLGWGDTTMNLCNISSGFDLSYSATPDVTSLFGYWNASSYGNSMSGYFTNNQVFDSAALPDLLCQLQKQRDMGKPAVAMGTYTTLENSWWGIANGREIKVMWFYNEVIADFQQQLPPDTQNEIRRGRHGAFENYPFMATAFQNPPAITAYTAPQVSLLAAQAEYAIRTHANEVEKFLTIN